MKNLRLITLLPIIMLSGCSLSVFKGDYHYNSEGYLALDSHELTLSQGIRNLNVNWINGDINIFYNEDNEFSIKESRSSYPLYYKMDEASLTLSIELAESGISADSINRLNKDLTIYLPSCISAFKMSTINTNINGNNEITVDELDINSVGGKLKFKSLIGIKTYFDVVNSDIEISNVGCLSPLRNATALINHQMYFDVVGANTTIGIKEELGYNVEFNAVNGKYKSSFRDKEKRYGDELIIIKYNAVDGDLTIKEVIEKE